MLDGTSTGSSGGAAAIPVLVLVLMRVVPVAGNTPPIPAVWAYRKRTRRRAAGLINECKTLDNCRIQ